MEAADQMNVVLMSKRELNSTDILARSETAPLTLAASGGIRQTIAGQKLSGLPPAAQLSRDGSSQDRLLPITQISALAGTYYVQSGGYHLTF